MSTIMNNKNPDSRQMWSKLYRNIAIVTAVFMVALSVMLIVNYFQVRQTTPLQSEVMETLKQLNESNDNNAELQSQIRQLDLLSRKAYFVQTAHLKWGVYILCGMAIVFVLTLRMYLKDRKNLPAKDMDILDEWLAKSRSRHYITLFCASVVALALLFAYLSSPSLQNKDEQEEAESTQLPESNGEVEAKGDSTQISEAVATDSVLVEVKDSAQTAAQEEVQDSMPIPKNTFNAFRGNNSGAYSGARGIPTSWNLNSGKNVLWHVNLPKHGYNSPIINGRNIFVTGADDAARELYCYDLFTGELRWKLAADNIPGSPSAMPAVTGDTGLAASTAATNGKQVCAAFATGDIICADMDGKRLWAKNLGVPDNHYGFASSLLIHGNTLIVQYENNSNVQILALNVTNGNQIWNISPKDKISWSSPIITSAGGKSILVVMGNPAITAYNPSNGSELWRVECMTGEVGASPAASNGIVYGASEYSTCIAIDAATGETKWEASDYLPEVSSPAATKSKLYVATSYGVVCAYDAESGQMLKDHDVRTPFYSSPVVVDGKVYLFSNSGKVYIFSAGEEFNLITSFETGEKTFATPAFTDGMMVVRTDKSLYCVTKQ